jgi:hypothetical protein
MTTREEARVMAQVHEVAGWRRGREIRKYFAETWRVLTGRVQVIEAGSTLDEWMKWVERTAVAMDPLRPPEAAQL